MLADLALVSDSPFDVLHEVKPAPNWQEGFIRLLVLLDSIRALSRPCDIAGQVIPYILPYYARKHPDNIVKRRLGLDRLADLLSNYASNEMQQLVDDLSCDYSEEAQDCDCINLYSIHAAKCREWRAVFVIGLTQGLFPDSRVSSDHLDEERRLFYVACTRAMERLFISWPRRIMTADRRFLQAPMSSFLFGINSSLYRTVAPPPF